MPRYLVERYLPDATPDQLQRDSARLAATNGGALRYLGSTFVPEDESYFAWFESESAEAVRAACEAVGVKFARVVETREVEREDGTP